MTLVSGDITLGKMTFGRLDRGLSNVTQQQQQQQHKLYLHDYNYVVTVLQKL